MKIREFVESKVNTSCETLIQKITYLEILSKRYPCIEIGIATFFYKDNFELLDKTMHELTAMNESKLEELENELNKEQFDKLINENSLLVASYNLVLIREDKRLLKEYKEELINEYLKK